MYNVSQAFRQELRKPSYQVSAKATMLDTTFAEIPNGDFFTGGGDEFQDVIVDGNVDVDQTRGTRRTASLTIVNKSGEFTPDNDVDFEGKFYVNRNVRIYSGVVLAGGTALYVPVGTFMVDVADTLVEKNMSVVNLTLSDHWKKFTKSLTTTGKTYAIGTPINTIIRELAARAGADFPLAPAIDPLSARVAGTTQLQTKWVLERGESVGDRLKELATQFGIDIYFNVEGRLTTNDRRDPRDVAEVWHFYRNQNTDEQGMLLSVRRTLTDDNLFNHIFVIGTADETHPVLFDLKDTNPASVTSVARIGDRVKIIESQSIKTQAQATAAGLKEWNNHFNLFEEVEIDTTCMPALDADDVIRITEPTLSKLSATYRIISLTVPLTSSRQRIRVARQIIA
jgi:hypothetical protein